MDNINVNESKISVTDRAVNLFKYLKAMSNEKPVIDCREYDWHFLLRDIPRSKNYYYKLL